MVNMALGGTGHTHTQTHFSNFGQKCDAFNSHKPQWTNGKSRSVDGYNAKNHLLGQRTAPDCGPVEVLGKWVSALPLQAHDGRAQRWVLWQYAARAVGV